MNEKTKKNIKILFTILKFALLIFLIAGIPLIVFFNYHELLEQFDSMESLRAFLDQYQTESVLVYFVMQVLQIVICMLPGQALQMVGGYVFHFWIGLLLTYTGAALGTFVTFHIARALGKDAMYLIFGEEKLNSYIEKLNSKRAFILLFIIYLIPGLPKDLFAYAIGVSNMRFRPVFIVSMIGRAPAMMGSVMIGAMMATGSYTGCIILFSIAVILCVLGAWKYKQLHAWVDKQYVKIMKIAK